MSVQCWHCGRFRKRIDVKVKRDWESGDISDIICRKCADRKHHLWPSLYKGWVNPMDPDAIARTLNDELQEQLTS